MAHLGTIIFRGHSGTAYEFQAWDVGTRFKPLSAVCLFTRRAFRNRNFAAMASHECMHIGQTADLSTISYQSRYAKVSDCICVHLVVDVEQRLAIERDLSASLGVWNSAFQVNLDARPPKEAGDSAVPGGVPPGGVA